MTTTVRPDLVDADNDTLLEAAEALFFDRYEGKVIPVTEGSFAGLSKDFRADTPFNIKVESCDEFDPTGDGYRDRSRLEPRGNQTALGRSETRRCGRHDRCRVACLPAR
jgi:hypothetical protein